MIVEKPYIQVLYNDRDITADITKYLLSLNYTDKIEGESDELDITLEDTEALWRGSWYPDRGAVLTVTIGKGNNLLECGRFEIDEIELSGPPDTVTIRALAASISGTLRTRRSYAHENKTLKQIALTVAARNKLTVLGEIGDIRIERVTQDRETDLGFLTRISKEYGYVFSVRGTTLVFTSIYDLEEAPASLSVDRLEIMGYSLRDKTSEVYTECKVSYHKPKEKKAIETTFTYRSGAFAEGVTGDVLEIRIKAETKAQAEIKAKAALHRANSKRNTGKLSTDGNTLLVAGNNMNLTGLGTLSGKYHILLSRHTIDKSGGYKTDVDIKRVDYVPVEQEVSVVKKAAKRVTAKKPANVVVKKQSIDEKEFLRQIGATNTAATLESISNLRR